MTSPFFPVPTTRGVGTPNPAADMNNTSLELLAMSGEFNVLNGNYSGGADPTGSADSTAAFQAAINALPTGGGPVVIPAGTYKINAGPLIPVSGLRLLGTGREAVTINSSGASFLNAGSAITDSVEIANIGVSGAGAHIITGLASHRWYIHDNQFTQTSAGFSIWNGTTGAGQTMVECTSRRNEYFVNGATRTAEAIFLGSASSSTQINGNSWEDEVFFNTNNDQAMYMIHIQAAGANNISETNSFKNILCEHPYGGMIWLESATGTVIDNVSAYDIPNTGTVSNFLIQITKNSTGLASGRNRIYNYNRIQGVVAFATNIGDISLDANTYNTTIVSPNGFGNLVMYLNGCKGPKLLGMPDGGWGVADSAFTLAAGTAAGAGPPAPVNNYQPDQQSGTVTFGTGTGATAGQQVQLTFGNPFQETPQVLVTPFSGASSTLGLFVSTPGSAGFNVSTQFAPTSSQANTAYGFRWVAWQ